MIDLHVLQLVLLGFVFILLGIAIDTWMSKPDSPKVCRCGHSYDAHVQVEPCSVCVCEDFDIVESPSRNQEINAKKPL